jgi:hypothetical protein
MKKLLLLLITLMLIPLVSSADGPEEKIWGSHDETVLAWYTVWDGTLPANFCVRPDSITQEACTAKRVVYTVPVTRSVVITGFSVTNIANMSSAKRCTAKLQYGTNDDFQTIDATLASVDVGDDIPAMDSANESVTIRFKQVLVPGSWWIARLDVRDTCTVGTGWQMQVLGYWQ